MICTKCNFQNEETAEFCSNCGMNLSVIKTCPKCNYQGGGSSHFCKNCGTRLVEKSIKPPKIKENQETQQTKAGGERKKLMLVIIAVGIVLAGLIGGYFMFKDKAGFTENGKYPSRISIRLVSMRMTLPLPS